MASVGSGQHISSGQYRGTPKAAGVQSGYRMNSGESATDMTILPGGYVYLDGGGSITNLTLDAASGGKDPGHLDGDTNYLNDSKQSIISGKIENYGDLRNVVIAGSETVYPGARATVQWISGPGATRTVYSGTTVSWGGVGSGGVDKILSGAVITAADVENGGTRILSGGATQIDTKIASGGRINLESGSLLSGRTGGGNGVNVAQGGVISGPMIGNTSGAPDLLGSGAKLSGVINNAGIVSGTVIYGGSSVETISSGANAVDQWVADSAVRNVSSGGTVTRGTVSGGAVDNISAGATAVSGAIWKDGTRNLQSGATGIDQFVRSSGTLVVSSGATVNGATVNSAGRVLANSAAVLSGLISNTGLISGGIVTGSESITSGGVHDGGQVASGGQVSIQSSGSFVNGQVASGAKVAVQNGGTFANGTIASGGTVATESGGTVSNVHVSSGAIATVSSGGVFSSGQVDSGGQIIVTPGGLLYQTGISGGTVTVSGNGPNDNGSTNGLRWIGSKGSANLSNTVWDNGPRSSTVPPVASTGSGVGLNSGNTIILNSGATWKNAYQNATGSSVVNSGGTADNIYMVGGDMAVNSGGVARNGDVASGAVINLASGGVVSGSNDKGYTIHSSGLISGAAGSGAVLSGLIVNSGIVSGTALSGSGTKEEVSAGAKAIDQWVTNSAVRNVSSGAVVSNGRIDNNGVDNILSGGSAISGSVANGGTRNLQSGAYTENDLVHSAGTVNVSSGATVNSAVVQSGGQILANSAGVLSGVISNDGLISGGLVKGSETITSNGVHSAGEIASGGNVTVLSGAKFSSGQVDSGGLLTVSSGGLLYQTNISGGTVKVFGNGPNDNGTTNGLQWVGSSGSAILQNTVWNNGTPMSSIPPVDSTGSGVGLNKDNTITLNSGATWRHAYINAKGHNVVNSGGTSDDIYMVGGDMVVNSGGKIGSSGATVGSGAVLTVSSGGTIDGTVQLVSGGSATVDKNAGGIIDMNGDKNTGLVITGLENGGTFTTRVTGFNGTKPESSNSGLSQAAGGDSDGIVLAGVKQADVKSVTYPDDNHVQIALKNGSIINLNVDNAKKQGFSLVSSHNRSGVQDGTLVYEVCFLAGSMIRTPSGETAVEEMKIGDVVQTLDAVSGTMVSKTVTWVGHKHADVDVTASDEDAGYPVRVLKDALGENVPSQDLLITAEHSLFVEGRFVPVRMLVNGRSIFYDRSFVSYDYYHVETEEHSVIWANNAPTESYLDTGNRRSFAQSGQVVDLSAGASAKSWASDAAVPLEVSRAFVEPVYHRLMARAIEAGVAAQTADRQVTHEHNLHLVTKDGQVLKAVRHSHDRVVFSLPPQTDGIRLVSRVGRPSVAVGPFVDDRRDLGVLIGEMVVLNAQSRHEVGAHLEQADLSGWDVQESSPCRWTQGNAYVPVKTGKDFSLFSVQVLAAGPYVLEEDASVSSVASISA
ncbi:Hint domain-containing protein [Swingsia samuiensis]|uniref:Hedgehog/Intein (Hint) domain-containing protein n=1 Tax=Swingsia samuiensis TaxID=1293412 RepID=A0A4Y6UGQ5_9PROT|nr:Hint domain-containing protein [Swingsia samuiensis]QDH16749.1 hypothetical protein E3D00_03580 [Swingsia samuiensis]